MICFIRGVVIMALWGLAIFAFLTWLTFAWQTFVAPARAETIDKPTLCAIAHSIFEEAGRDERAAEKLARERGFTSRQIWAAKKLCK